jgi:cyclopropane fatty-acyl-phospholipid synthase-like methyltransferase
MRRSDRMSDLAFRLMIAVFRLLDTFFPYIDRRVRSFGLAPGMTVVDYGCGPGRYSLRFARLVGESGKVYAVDIHELAVEAVRRLRAQHGLANLEAVLARGYDTGLPPALADRVCAIDMFFSVRDPGAFLAEIDRLLKPEGLLLLDDGHQSRAATRAKLAASGRFEVLEETRDHLTCRKREAPEATGR